MKKSRVLSLKFSTRSAIIKVVSFHWALQRVSCYWVLAYSVALKKKQSVCCTLDSITVKSFSYLQPLHGYRLRAVHIQSGVGNMCKNVNSEILNETRFEWNRRKHLSRSLLVQLIYMIRDTYVVPKQSLCARGLESLGDEQRQQKGKFCARISGRLCSGYPDGSGIRFVSHQSLLTESSTVSQ